MTSPTAILSRHCRVAVAVAVDEPLAVPSTSRAPPGRRPKQGSQTAWPQGRATTGSLVSRQTGQQTDAKTLFPQARRAGCCRQVGQATSTTWSPTCKRYLALAQVKRPYNDIGRVLEIEHTVEFERRRVEATVVERPFFDPERKRSTPGAKPKPEAS